MKASFTSLLALALLTGPAAAAAQTSPPRERIVVREHAVTPPVLYQRGASVQTDTVTRTLKIGATGELVLSNLAGPITVTAGGGNTATLEIVKTARGSSADEAREMLGRVIVEVLEQGTRAEIRARYPERSRGDRRPLHVSVAYTVTAPAETRVTARSLSGDIRMTNIRGELSVDATSGNVEVTGAGRLATAKSISGHVTLTGIRTEAGLDASSISGNVTVRDVEARRLSVNSISGNIALEGAAAERVEAQTMSGNVVYAGVIARGGRYDFKSHSGDVRLRIDGSTGFELDASTFSGSIRSDLPLTTRAGDRIGDAPGRRRAFRGTFGDGSAFINATTFSGSVVIGKR
jgi:hypothetical protein